MARRALVVVIVLAWIGGLAVGVYHMQARLISRLQYQRPWRDTLNLPQMIDEEGNEIGDEELPKLGKLIAMGYDQMVASLLWLRVIQTFGAKLQHVREEPRVLHAIENLFYVVTELDPRFVEAYKFGNFVLGDEGGDYEAALRLLDRGIVKNYKRTYILPYEAVFICLTNLQDYDRARFYLRLALRAPDVPEYVPRMERYIQLKKGNYEIALERWVRDSLNAALSNNPQFENLADTQINNIVNQWHLSIINAAIDRYFERNQDYPARIEQLEQQDLVGTVRQTSGPLLRALLAVAKDRRIPPNTAVDLILGLQGRPGCIVESNRAPRDLRGEAYLLIDHTVPPFQKRPSVVERGKARQETLMTLMAIRRRIDQFRNSRGRYPFFLEELPEMSPGSEEKLPPEDPAGLPWSYNPIMGQVRSHVFLDL